MSLTETAVTRFWRTMSERYGARWLDTYTDQPTTAWRDCIKHYSPQAIAGAIALLDAKEHTRQHPPTEPEFRALLKQAARHASQNSDNPNELRRGYWRSTIINAVARELGYTMETLEPVVIANKHSLGRAMRDLLDEVDELEVRTGQRTKGQEDLVREGAHRVAIAYNALRAAQKQPEQQVLAPPPQPASSAPAASEWDQ